MTLFGFDTSHNVLEKEKFFDSAPDSQEDVAVYNWGESDYDGLGDALQEGGDEMNDETFGGGPVGKDFDFSNAELPGFKLEKPEPEPEPHREYQDTLLHGKSQPPSRRGGTSLESIWDDKSPISVLPGVWGPVRPSAANRSPATFVAAKVQVLPAVPPTSRTTQPSVTSQQGIRTLQDIEAEMRAKQYQQNHGSQSSGVQQYSPMASQSLASASVPVSSPVTTQFTQSGPSLHRQSTPQLTPDEVEHQLRMMHLTQLHHHQAQRQEHQQQPLYQSVPQQRQHRMQTPDQDRQYVLHQRQLHRSIPPTPEPQFPLSSQPVQTAPYHNSLAHRYMVAHLSQSGVVPDNIQFLDPAQKEAIMNEAIRKIMAAEVLDLRNRRRLMKMERMARYNDLMTQSDKDFITRIQVSQLVTSDPYTEDFYAQVLGTLRRNGTGVRWFGNTGVGSGLPAHRLSGRREHAMNRMAEQVYRIVENAKAREKERGQHGGGYNPLQGVLGKTSGRSYKAAPRQLLQVDAGPLAGSPTSSPKLREAEVAYPMAKSRSLEDSTQSTSEKLPHVSVDTGAKEPLTRRQTLAIIENLFDCALEWENNRRLIPEEGTEAHLKWQADQKAIEARMWEGSQVTAPLEARYPHPLVSLLGPLKGKKVMRRLTRVMDARQLRITLTLVTRLFRDFDVVQNHHIAESLVESKEKHEMEKHIHIFEEFVLEAILPALAVAPLPVVSGQLQHLRDPVVIARTRPGIILLTHIFTRAAIIKDRTLTFRTSVDVEGITQDDVATLEEFQEWQRRFDELFQELAPHFLSFFPSSRAAASLPLGAEHTPQMSSTLDAADHPVWSFFASMAIPASLEQQSALVTQLREKVLENVVRAHQGWATADEGERSVKLRNVNIFLHALGLDSSQIVL